MLKSGYICQVNELQLLKSFKESQVLSQFQNILVTFSYFCSLGRTVHTVYIPGDKKKNNVLCLPLSLNLKTLYGSFSSKLCGILTSSTSGILCRAHLKRVFQVEGSADSPGLYFPVCSAHSLKSMASFSTSKSGLPACFHETRNSFFAWSLQHSPGTFPLLILSSSHGLNLCRSSDISSENIYRLNAPSQISSCKIQLTTLTLSVKDLKDYCLRTLRRRSSLSLSNVHAVCLLK